MGWQTRRTVLARCVECKCDMSKVAANMDLLGDYEPELLLSLPHKQTTVNTLSLSPLSLTRHLEVWIALYGRIVQCQYISHSHPIHTHQ